MTDIVDRLRKFCKWPEPGDGIPDDPVFANVPDLKEAADEIERLRKEVAGAMILADMLRDSSLGHQERAERLRVALRRISLASQNSGTTKEFLGREARVALGEDSQ